MTEREAIEQSEAHWYRMIDWVEKQDGGEDSDDDVMESAIGESWYSDDCALCITYQDRVGCDKCPLGKIGKACYLKKSTYSKVDHSTTWSEWLIHANEMLEILKGLKK